VPETKTNEEEWRAFLNASLPTEGLEHRQLTLKGREEPVDVVVLGAAAPVEARA
jgi:hypothetical protein